MSFQQLNVELSGVGEDDPLFAEKNEMILHRGYSYTFRICREDSMENFLDAMLKVARILKLNEIELYFVEDDDFGPFTARNEIEALNYVLSVLQSLRNSEEACMEIDTLVGRVLNMLASMTISQEPQSGMPCEGDNEAFLLKWVEKEGVKSKLDVAVFEGYGRGGRAVEDIAVGDIVLEIPQHLIISEVSITDSEMFMFLSGFEELSGETITLLWSMKERFNRASRFAPYFSSLSKNFNTGLSIGLSALQALDGTMVIEQILQAREHLRSQYDSIFPALSNLYPNMFPEEHYTWDKYLWACELWYSNGLKLCFPDEKIRTCLVPVLGMLNHELCPHITHFSKIDSATGKLILRSVRPCKIGQQCFLNYGPFSNSHFFTFYGFILDKNPFDVVPIDLDIPDDSYQLTLLKKWKLGNSHMLRGCWFSRSQLSPFGLPSRLLSALRVALSEESEAEHLFVAPHCGKLETNAVESLLSIVNNMEDCVGEYITEDGDVSSWDIALAVAFKDNQRKLLRSVSEACMLTLRSFDLK